MSPFHNNSGYLRVNLSTDDGTRKFYVHRLVALAFIPNVGNKKLVNHVDEDKQNNTLGNLEWASSSENVRLSRDANPNAYRQREIHCRELNITVKNAGEMADLLLEKKIAEGARQSVMARINNMINGHSKSGKYFNLTFQAIG